MLVGGADGAPRVVAVHGDDVARGSWASVTKLLVTMAVLVAAEERTLALDDPAGPPGSTVRHLLAHASGLGPEATDAVRPAGQRRVYSNAGFEVLAAAVEQRAQMPFADYLGEGVLGPLGMGATAIGAGRSPAWGATGTLADLLRLGAELLDPHLLGRSTLAEATTTAFPGLAGFVPGLGFFDPCDWGLGFELHDAKAPHWTSPDNSARTFGHFGRSGAFVWVDPVAKLACAAMSRRTFGPWALNEWPALSTAVLEAWG